jgi:hypothetical protein
VNRQDRVRRRLLAGHYRVRGRANEPALSHALARAAEHSIGGYAALYGGYDWKARATASQIIWLLFGSPTDPAPFRAERWRLFRLETTSV